MGRRIRKGNEGKEQRGETTEENKRREGKGKIGGKREGKKEGEMRGEMT